VFFTAQIVAVLQILRFLTTLPNGQRAYSSKQLAP